MWQPSWEGIRGTSTGRMSRSHSDSDTWRNYWRCSWVSRGRWRRTPCHRQTVVSCTVRCLDRRRRPGQGTARSRRYLHTTTRTLTYIHGRNQIFIREGSSPVPSPLSPTLHFPLSFPLEGERHLQPLTFPGHYSTYTKNAFAAAVTWWRRCVVATALAMTGQYVWHF